MLIGRHRRATRTGRAGGCSRCAATRRIERSLPAPIQIGGCGRCAVGGSTTISSKCQYMPAVRERLVGGPCLDDHVEAFVKARIGLGDGHAEADELVVAIALADPEIEPPAGQQIERRRLLGEQYRVVPRQHHDRRAEAQPAGARTEPGQKVDRRRDLAIAGEMVLDDKAAVKAQRLGLDIVVDKVAETLGAVELGLFGLLARRAVALPNRPNCIASPSLAKPTRCGEVTATPAMFKMPPLDRRHNGSACQGTPAPAPVSGARSLSRWDEAQGALE